MNREARLQMFETRLADLALGAKAGACVEFEVARQAGQYVLFVRVPGGINAEVARPVWTSGPRRREAEKALGCLGFGRSSSGERFSREALPLEPRRLACLAELLFGAVYGADPDHTPVAASGGEERDARLRTAAP